MNKQPFYHSITVLFTATREVTRTEVEEKLRKAVFPRDVIKMSITVEECSAEPGDPADLM